MILIQKVERRLAIWQTHQLSFLGRIPLVINVLLSNLYTIWISSAHLNGHSMLLLKWTMFPLDWDTD